MRNAPTDRPRQPDESPGTGQARGESEAEQRGQIGDHPEDQLDEAEQAAEEEAEERASPSGRVLYAAIVKEGREELDRPTSALFWSGVAAGLSMALSLVGQALLRHHLPDEPWARIIDSFGYSLGFLVVVLGRQQLFTENTLTPILPLLQEPSWRRLGNVGRLWGIVLVANLLGAAGAALFLMHTSALPSGLLETVGALAAQAMAPAWHTVFLRGIIGGFLIALMVWLLPFAEVARFWVIIVIAAVVGLGGFSHSIAGAVDVFCGAALGQSSWWSALGHFVVPAILGNVVGGVLLVSALNHAQVVAGKERAEEKSDQVKSEG